MAPVPARDLLTVLPKPAPAKVRELSDSGTTHSVRSGPHNSLRNGERITAIFPSAAGWL